MRVQVGTRVCWIAKGDLARREKLDGQRMTGTVENVDRGYVYILPDHRRSNSAMFAHLRACILESDPSLQFGVAPAPEKRSTWQQVLRFAS